MKNRQLLVTQWGEVPSIHITAIPEPGPGEVLIRVEASSLCFTDTLLRRGIYPGFKQKPAFVLGYDFIGRIEQLGAGVSQWQAGERVAALTVSGANADWLICQADRLARVPETVDACQAESLILSWVTAWQMLTRLAKTPDQGRILVPGAAGAVGNALVQLAKLRGIEVVATASERDHVWLREQGLATVIDYRDPQRWQKIRAAAPDGFDAVFEGIGPENILPAANLLKSNGVLVCFGFVAAARDVQKPSLAIILRSLVMVGNAFARLAWVGLRHQQFFYDIKASADQQRAEFIADLEALFQLLDQGRIQPVVKGLSFTEASAAHAALTLGSQRGRLSLNHQNV